MFLTVEVWVCLDEEDEDDENYELAEIDLNPMHIESIEPEMSIGDNTYLVMSSGTVYTVNMPFEDFRKLVAFSQVKTFLS